jgi:hypothetical protein
MISISRLGALLFAIWLTLVGLAAFVFTAPAWLMGGLALVGGICLLITAVRAFFTA